MKKLNIIKFIIPTNTHTNIEDNKKDNNISTLLKNVIDRFVDPNPFNYPL